MTTANANLSFLDRHHFLLRRLHSLSGIVPVGAFLINHLLANSTAFLGAKEFDHHIGLIHSLPWLLGIEVTFIFIPLAFHAIYGLAIAWEGKLNAQQYPYMDNWRYTLQRITAYIVFVFIIFHLLHFRFAWLLGGQPYGGGTEQFFGFTQRIFHSPDSWLPLWAWITIYAIGTTAAVYHFCHGIVTFCITWGITVGDEARKKVSWAALVLGLLLMTWTTSSLIGLSRGATGETPPQAVHAAAPMK